VTKVVPSCERDEDHTRQLRSASTSEYFYTPTSQLTNHVFKKNALMIFYATNKIHEEYFNYSAQVSFASEDKNFLY
jgi:hypothetical protein